jgi:glycosyltransferase involved in cell wall biosynthesis
MLKIAFDARTLLAPRTGIGRYLDGYLKALLRYHPQNEYYLCIHKKITALPYPAKTITSSYNLPEEIWEHFCLSGLCRANHINILHSPQEGGPISSKKFRWLATIHDLIPLRFPTLYFRNMAHKAYYHWKLKNVKKHANKILTVSKATAEDIMSFLQIPATNIEIIHTPPDDIFMPIEAEKTHGVLERYHIKSPYFLAIGSMEPRKNLKNILLAYKELLQETKDLPRLVLFGHAWRKETSKTLIEKMGLSKHIIHLGGVSENDLPALYSGAIAFVYPSLYEGFGLPVLEAMACGCPVITSNTSSLPEIAQDAAILVNPSKPEEIKNALADLSKTQSLREAFIHKGFEKVKQFSWQNATNKLMALYESL